MLKKIMAHNCYELMWMLSKVIDPMEFPEGKVSYFILQPIDESSFEIVRNDDAYSNDSEFGEAVGNKISRKEIYGIISFGLHQIQFTFCGLNFYSEFIYRDDQWQLKELDDLDIKDERTWSERRFEISHDFAKLKKVLS